MRYLDESFETLESIESNIYKYFAFYKKKLEYLSSLWQGLINDYIPCYRRNYSSDSDSSVGKSIYCRLVFLSKCMDYVDNGVFATGRGGVWDPDAKMLLGWFEKLDATNGIRSLLPKCNYIESGPYEVKRRDGNSFNVRYHVASFDSIKWLIIRGFKLKKLNKDKSLKKTYAAIKNKVGKLGK